MKVLLLSPYPEMLHHALCEAGDTYIDYKSSIPFEISSTIFQPPDVDWIVSFGYRNIIPPHTIDRHKDRIINIHIGFLPWNRGADPNFWSWFDDTPKGITIHRIDEGIDTGGILVQEELKKWQKGETLHSSWHHLMGRAKALFESEWKNIRRDGLPTRHVVGGTYHKKADKDEWLNHLPNGWLTPVRDVVRLGKEHRGSQCEAKDRHPRPRKYRQPTFKEF